MEQALKRAIVPLFVLALPLGLAALVASARPAVAEPAAVTPLPPVGEVDGRAGANYAYYYDPPEGPERPFIPMAYDVGSRWDRFDFIWPNLEPSNDNWSSSVLEAYDSVVDDLQAGGITNIVGILLWTPDWAATSGLQGLGRPAFDQRPPGWYAPVSRSALAPTAVSFNSSPPQGLYLDWDDPDNHWGDFVYTVTSRYKDRVKVWEMWNEAEWDYFWTGSDADYAQLLKVGYQATKAACPDCTVLFAGLHYWDDPTFFERVLDILNDDPDAPANDYFFDVMSVHLYSRSSTVYDTVNDIRGRMRLYVPDHPIWLTETGVPIWGDPNVAGRQEKYDYAATQDEAAEYVVQSYANAWASGVERFFFFRTHDEAMNEYFGLLRNDHSLRPAYVAYQVATRYLISPTMTTSWSYTRGYRRVTLWGTPRGKVSVVWNTTPQTLAFDYPAVLTSATLVDRWGVTQTISATDGVYALTLPGATANLVSNPDDYIIGGEPYLVIEADTAPPTVALRSLPTTTYSTSVPVSWEAGDDAAGVWGVDLQVREGGSGTWADWLRFTQTQGITSAQYTGGEHDQTYCFRARAWDRAGNHGEWPAEAQACTRLYTERQVHLEVGAVYGDADGDGIWDSGEVTLTNVSMRFVDGDFIDVVTPTVAGSWSFTVTVTGGEYALVLTPEGWWSPPPGWLPHVSSVTVLPGEALLVLSYPEVGLRPHHFSYIFPLAMHNG